MTLKSPKVVLVLALMLAASMWCYVDLVLVPYEKADAILSGRPRGNLSDLYPRWLGARELLLHGRNPYAPQITREIQEGYYGRAINPALRNDPTDQQGFAYPVYVTFLLAPTVRLPFPLVQAGFRWLLVLLVAASVPLWLYALRWKVSVVSMMTGIVLALGSFPAVQGIKLQQLTLLACSLLAASAASLVAGQPVLGGILLALATIKPQLAVPFVCWLALWTVSNWRSRQRFAWSFLLGMTVLMAGGEILLPGWIGQFRAATLAYLDYAGGKSLLDLALGPSIGRYAAAFVVILVAAFCWYTRREPADSEPFRWTLVVVSTATLTVIPTFAPYNQLLLLPAIMVLLRSTSVLSRTGKLHRLSLALAGIIICAPWFATLLLNFLLIFMSQARVERAWAVPLWTSWITPFPVLAAVALGSMVIFKSRSTEASSVAR